MKFLWGVYGFSLAIFLTAQLVVLIIWRDLAVHLGLLAGYALGIVPLASWHLIVGMTDGFRKRERLWQALSLGVGKYALVGVGLYFLITKEWVNNYALTAGMFVMVPALVILGVLRQKPEEGKES